MSTPSTDNALHTYTLWLDAVKSGGTTPSLLEYRRWSEFDPNLFWHLSCGDHQNLLDEAINALDARPAVDVDALASSLESSGLAEPEVGYGHATGHEVAEHVVAYLRTEDSAR